MATSNRKYNWTTLEALEQVSAALPDVIFAKKFNIEPKVIFDLEKSINEARIGNIDLNDISRVMTSAVQALPAAWKDSEGGVGDELMRGLDQARMNIGKLMLAEVLADVGIKQVSQWENHGNNWDYALVVYGDTVLNVGVSSGSVISFDGDPFTARPDKLMNVNSSTIKQSLLEKLPELKKDLDAGVKIEVDDKEIINALLGYRGFVKNDDNVLVKHSGMKSITVALVESNTKPGDFYKMFLGSQFYEISVFNGSDKQSYHALPIYGHEFIDDVAKKIDDYFTLSQSQFNGRIMSIFNGIATQKIGRTDTETKTHALNDLVGEPLEVGDVVNIQYKDGKGIVSGLSKSGHER